MPSIPAPARFCAATASDFVCTDYPETAQLQDAIAGTAYTTK